MHQSLHHPQPDERQLTWRAVLAGCTLGAVMSSINIYFGLRTGWAIGGSIMTAIVAFSFFRYVCGQRDFSILENNICQTAGSGAGYMSAGMGLTSVVPALALMQQPLPVSTLYIWGLSIATLGVFYAQPLRQTFIIKQGLRFPTGIATAETIVALHHSECHDNRARVLFLWSVVAGTLTLLSYFVPAIERVPVMTWLGFSAATHWGFLLFLSPMLIGGGILVGVRVGSSLGLGCVLAWGLLGPQVAQTDWVSGGIFDYKNGVQGWLLWPGVSLMVVDALVTFLLSVKRWRFSWSLKNKLTQSSDVNPQHVPAAWWLCGLLVTSLATVFCLQVYFNIPAFLTIIALALSWLLAGIATRAAGETDINPATAVAKLTQLSYGALAPGQTLTNMMAAGVTAAGAATCADMMQDFKSGFLLGANPRKQFIAQLAGCYAGILVSVPIYQLFARAYDIGSAALPAPAAHAWVAMSVLLTQGVHALPTYAGVAVSVAGMVGLVLALLRYRWQSAWLPSGVAMGITFIIPPYYALDFFIGAMVLLLWQTLRPTSSQKYAFVVASGLLVGEGLMGMVKAIMTLLGVPTWVS